MRNGETDERGQRTDDGRGHRAEIALRYLMILTTEPTKAHATYFIVSVI